MLAVFLRLALGSSLGERPQQPQDRGGYSVLRLNSSGDESSTVSVSLVGSQPLNYSSPLFLTCPIARLQTKRHQAWRRHPTTLGKGRPERVHQSPPRGKGKLGFSGR